VCVCVCVCVAGEGGSPSPRRSAPTFIQRSIVSTATFDLSRRSGPRDVYRKMRGGGGGGGCYAFPFSCRHSRSSNRTSRNGDAGLFSRGPSAACSSEVTGGCEDVCEYTRHAKHATNDTGNTMHDTRNTRHAKHATNDTGNTMHNTRNTRHAKHEHDTRVGPRPQDEPKTKGRDNP